MKTITFYDCEICGGRYPDEAAARACEAVPVRRIGLEPGEIVTAGHAYGWWKNAKGETVFRGDPQVPWFLYEPGDPDSRNHLERAKLGYPKFVVLEIVPYSQVSSSSGGAYSHQEAALVYCPAWENGPPTLYAWLPATGHHKVRRQLGRVSDSDLASYREAVKGQAPVLV